MFCQYNFTLFFIYFIISISILKVEHLVSRQVHALAPSTSIDEAVQQHAVLCTHFSAMHSIFIEWFGDELQPQELLKLFSDLSLKLAHAVSSDTSAVVPSTFILSKQHNFFFVVIAIGYGTF